ncbi:TonB-dependent receptor [Xaviernesmea oryzae]|uniref:TonB-dependent receptor n=1 Tax=Xaviernesmea oryzae TaxID=464029 RepID=A0A1Q9AYS2_9HYPH|nr:TonB-dependent siderophore receptor [Xaviernesmea oryzae]OLP60598.1 TonB-dependent receptor [Xaviernesmea oryzae]SEM32689.1 iron complex outermembrane recepter protein [Xaviernesmea oryzae]
MSLFSSSFPHSVRLAWGRAALGILLTSAAVGPSWAQERPAIELDTATTRARHPGAEEATVLPTITATDRPEHGPDPVEGVAAHVTVTATKTDTPLIDVPQAISVVPRAQLDQQGVKSVADSLRYTPGVFADTRIGGVLESVFLRGFGGFAAGATNPQFLDGLPLAKGDGWAAQVIDPYALERVEVLRGPASVLYGQASPGGIVNMVSKRPTDEPFHEVTLTTGNRDRAEAAFDLGGPITKDGEWSYRFSGLGRRVDEQADFSKQQRVLLAPTLAWAPDADTSLTVFGFYQNDPHNNFAGWLPANGTLFPNPAGRIPRSFFPGEPDFDSYDRQQTMIGYAFEHRFDETWTLRQNLRYADVDTSFEGVAGNFVFPFGATSSQLNRAASWSDESLDGLSIDNQAEARFDTGALRHTVLLGLSYQGSWADTLASGFGDAPPIDYRAPVYGRPFARPPVAQDDRQDWSRTGIYVQDQIRIDRLALTFGGRQDWSMLDTKDRLGGGTTHQDDQAFTGRVGAVYLFDNGLAPYASYSTSFEPVLGTAFGGEAFEPTTARQTEVGIKYQPPGKDSFVGLSGFDITQENVGTVDPLHPFYKVQTGEVRSRGIEVEARAALTDRLDLIGAYTWLDTTVQKDTDPLALGKRFVAVPDVLASLWTTYHFTDGALAGLSLSGGARYVGKSAGDPVNSFSVPATTLFDAAIRYDVGAMRPDLTGVQAALNVTNLFDKRTVSSCFNAGGCFYGNGRLVTASLSYRW